MNTAYFTKHPRTAQELRRPRSVDDAVPYEVVGTVTLSKTDYDNFATDMLVSRDFLEESAADCGLGSDGVMRCLQIECSGRDSLLVVPEAWGYVGLAAVL